MITNIQSIAGSIDNVVLGLLVFIMAGVPLLVTVQNRRKHPTLQEKRTVSQHKKVQATNYLEKHEHTTSDDVKTDKEQLDLNDSLSYGEYSATDNSATDNSATDNSATDNSDTGEFDTIDLSQYYFPKPIKKVVDSEIEPECESIAAVTEVPLIFIEMPVHIYDTTEAVEDELTEYIIDHIDHDTYELFIGGKATLTPEQFEELRQMALANKNSYPDFSGVYVILNQTLNKTYVGQSIHVMKRLRDHFSGHGKGETGSALLYRDYYNGNGFLITVIPIHDAPTDNLNKLERILIAKFDSFKTGYNKTRGNHD